VFVAIFDGSHVPIADEQSEDETIDQHQHPEVVAEGSQKHGDADPNDRNQTGQPIRKLQLVDVIQRHAQIEDDDGGGQQHSHLVGSDLLVA